MRNNESNIFLDLSQMLEFHEKSYTFINQGEKCIMDFQLSSELLKKTHSVKFKKRVIDPNTYKHKHIILRHSDTGKQPNRYRKNFEPDIDLKLESLIEKYKTKEGKLVTKRYKIPYWIEGTNEEGEETMKKAFKPAIGRPFIFIAKEVLDKYEYEEFMSNTIENEENTLPF